RPKSCAGAGLAPPRRWKAVSARSLFFIIRAKAIGRLAGRRHPGKLRIGEFFRQRQNALPAVRTVTPQAFQPAGGVVLGRGKWFRIPTIFWFLSHGVSFGRGRAE